MPQPVPDVPGLTVDLHDQLEAAFRGAEALAASVELLDEVPLLDDSPRWAKDRAWAFVLDQLNDTREWTTCEHYSGLSAHMVGLTSTWDRRVACKVCAESSFGAPGASHPCDACGRSDIAGLLPATAAVGGMVVGGTLCHPCRASMIAQAQRDLEERGAQ